MLVYYGFVFGNKIWNFRIKILLPSNIIKQDLFNDSSVDVSKKALLFSTHSIAPVSHLGEPTDHSALRF